VKHKNSRLQIMAQ